MGELSKPIMTPVGVVYRNLHASEAAAMKFAEWAVKVFGGQASTQTLIGPGRKGYYESAIMAKVDEKSKNVKPRKTPPDESWMKEEAPAYVLFDATETPVVLYFHKHDLLYRPSPTTPYTAYHVISLEQ